MDLLQNPFYILAVSPRDNRRQIVEQAEERSLLFDSEQCTDARTELTTPRKRLSAEVAWLPGVGPKRAEELLALLESTPMDLIAADKLPSIARANVLAAGLARLPDHNTDGITPWILEIAATFENVNPDELRAIINDDRVVSGFSEVSDLSAIETEIQERRRYYLKVIKSALDNLSSKDLVEAVTFVVETETCEGYEHAPVLITDLVDAYEVDAQGFLEKEEENINAIVERLRTAVDRKRLDSSLAPMVNRLIQVVKNWDAVAQPIQLSAKSRGLDHDASHRIARLVRGLAIHMFNEHGKLDFSLQLTSMLQEVFAEVGDVAERIAEDANVLEKMAERKKLSRLLDPISDLCKIALESTEIHPSFADREAQKIINTAPQLIANLSASSPGAEILSQGKDEIALTLMHCAVIYGNETTKWRPCLAFLEEALKYASSQEVRSKIQENLKTVRGNDRLYGDLEPITSAPKLYTINGIGTTLYGSADREPVSDSYLSTYYFVFFAIPIFPISRYRVIETGLGYRFLGKSPLRTFDKWHIVISLGLIAGCSLVRSEKVCGSRKYTFIRKRSNLQKVKCRMCSMLLVSLDISGLVVGGMTFI